MVLRSLEPEDFEDFFEYLEDRNLCKMYFGLSCGFDRETAMQVFRAFQNGDKTYALFFRQEEKMVGHIIVTDLELNGEEAEFLLDKRGKTLAFAVSPKYQRNGLATESLKAVFSDLFSGRGFDYIHCAYFDFNDPSAELQKKLGFQPFATRTIRTQVGEVKVIHNILFNGTEEKYEI